MFDYDEDSKKAAETLDKYDFTPILKRCYGVDIYDIEDGLRIMETMLQKRQKTWLIMNSPTICTKNTAWGFKKFLDTALGGMTESKVE